MPRYFLHIRRGREYELDREGAEFASIEALQRETVTAAARVWNDFPNLGMDPAHYWIEVTDAAGHPVFALRFADAVSRASRR